jgi:iron complex transport system permease protein
MNPVITSRLYSLSQRGFASWQRTTVILVSLAAALFAVIMVAVNWGAYVISPFDVIQAVLGGGTDDQRIVVMLLRLPRILVAILGGIGLATAGTIFQSLMRNPLADPGIIGINAGASLGAVIVIIYGGSAFNVADSTVHLLPVAALCGAFAAALLIYGIAWHKGGIAPMRLAIIGVAVGSGLSGLMTIILMRQNFAVVQMLRTFTMGSVWGATWTHVQALYPWILILFPLVFYKAAELNILTLGDSIAIGLGAFLERERMILLLAGVGLAGASVAIVGGIGFVGLLAPHIARRLVGSNHRFVLPASALIGAILVLSADCVGRNILVPIELPAGLVIALIGAPYFLYLLTRQWS